jgi:hypothetical protein
MPCYILLSLPLARQEKVSLEAVSPPCRSKGQGQGQGEAEGQGQGSSRRVWTLANLIGACLAKVIGIACLAKDPRGLTTGKNGTFQISFLLPFSKI